MSLDFSSLSALSNVGPLDLSTAAKGATQEARIKQVSKAMESLFIGQLTAEMGKGLGGTSESKEEGGQYSDFIHQAMTQGMTQGSGFGLARAIESYLTQNKATGTPHLELKPNNKSYHVNRVE
jgi:Rod binding domain-containing protein